MKKMIPILLFLLTGSNYLRSQTVTKTDLYKHCNQWADACKAAGMTYGILTTKHHDGFCLWDSKYTDYDIANSSVKRDVVAKYVKAFRSRGLKPCLYFSIWDRHNGVENGGSKEEEFITKAMQRYDLMKQL